MYRNGIQNYRRTNVITSDPMGLVLMCYEGAIDNLKLAKQRIIEKDYEGKNKAIVKAQEIIHELLCSLNFEKGGMIARNLDSLYNYMMRRLIRANVDKDIRAVDEVSALLSEMQSAWKEIYKEKSKSIQTEPRPFTEEKRVAGNHFSV